MNPGYSNILTQSLKSNIGDHENKNMLIKKLDEEEPEYMLFSLRPKDITTSRAQSSIPNRVLLIEDVSGFIQRKKIEIKDE